MRLFKKAGFYAALVLLTGLGLLFFLLYKVQILSDILLVLSAGGALLLWFLCVFLLFRKSLPARIFGWLLCLILAAGALLGSYYLYTAYDVLKLISASSDQQQSVAECYVLRTGLITEEKELNGTTIGYLGSLDSAGTAGIVKKLQEQDISFELKAYDSSLKMVQDLKGMAIDAMILNQSYLAVIADYEGQEDIEEEVIPILSCTYQTSVSNESSEVDVTTSPFTILISGIDTYGEISETSRSDVNLLLTVNPKTHTILMLSIPRDYYTETVCDADMGCANGKMDKLTHTGLHGIAVTEMTLEKLLDMKINYNVRVNFSSLISIVDEIGGITVNNPKAFDAFGYSFPEGDIHLDGQEALAFSRERYSFTSGDRERGRNQMRVLEGILNQLIRPSSLKNYPQILKTLANSFQTNMSMEEITALIRFQISHPASWKLYNYSLTGSDGNEYAYELGDYAYVMLPDEESLRHAKDDIKAVENGEAPLYKNN